MNTRFAIALTLIVALASAAPAKKKSVNVNGRESSGFNALNHALQKPLGNPTFPDDNKGFGRNIYFGFNAGGSMISNNVWENTRPGFNAGAHFGGWFTPVHGMRISATGGKYLMPAGVFDAWYGALRADYMMNLTTLLRGYDPNRKFELIGGAGLKYQLMRQSGKTASDIGMSASLQMRFNVTKSFYLYLEPEVSMIAGRKPTLVNNWSRMYSDLAMNVGFGYRLLTGQQRLAGSTKFEQSAEDNIFYGLSGGLFTLNRSGEKFDTPMAALFMGKMFSSTSGIQLTGRLGHIHKTKRYSKDNIGMLTLDYVLNLNNAFAGYRPDQIFQISLNAGPAAIKAQDKNKIYGGVHAGITGHFRLSPNWGIFVGPQLYAFPKDFSKNIGMSTRRPIVSLDLGLRYTVGDFSRRFKDAHFTPADSTQRWFFNAAIGVGKRYRLGEHKLLDGYVGIGRRFTPISSWRLNIDGQYFRHYGRITAGIDYLSSITTAMMGYKENRVFDLQAVAGLFGGGAQFTDRSVKATFGAKGGFQANFRITEKWGIYFEPQILAVYGTSQYNDTFWSPEARIQLGVKYNW